MRRIIFALLIGALSSGCFIAANSEQPFNDFALHRHVAVGSVATAGPLLQCRSEDSFSEHTCQFHKYDHMTASVDDPSIFELLPIEEESELGGRIRLRALKPGRTIVRTTLFDTGGTGYESSQEIEAHVPDQIEAEVKCEVVGAQPPFLFPVGENVEVRFTMKQGDELLWSMGMDQAFQISNGEILEDFLGRVAIRLPSTPGITTVTSSAVPSFKLDLETYEVKPVEPLLLRLADGSHEHFKTFNASHAPIAFQIGYAMEGKPSRPVCRNGAAAWSSTFAAPKALNRTVQLLTTPSTSCVLDSAGALTVNTGEGSWNVLATGEGHCKLTASIDGVYQASYGLWLRSDVASAPGAWKIENPGPIGGGATAFSGTSANDLWVASAGSIHHFDGTSWKWTPTGFETPINALWSNAPDDVWAAGGNGLILHWDGTTWGWVHTHVTHFLNALWGTTPDDLYAVGWGGTVLHYDGTAWSNVPGPEADLFSIFGSSDGADLWVGSLTGVYRRTGNGTWQREDGAPAAAQFVTGTSAFDVWAASKSAVAHWNGAMWTTLAPPSGEIRRILSTDVNQVVAVTAHGTYFSTGGGWTSLSSPFAGTTAWRQPQGPVWLSGVRGELATYDGTAWTMKSTGPNDAKTRFLRDVWGVGPTDVWAVGENDLSMPRGVVMRRDAAGAWSVVFEPGDAMNAVWASSASDVWVAGANGSINHFNGSTWSYVPSGTTKDLRDIWGSGPNDIWFVGEGSIVVHWDGTKLTRSVVGQCVAFCGDADHKAIWGTGPNDVWMAGSSDFADWNVWHWNGSRLDVAHADGRRTEGRRHQPVGLGAERLLGDR